MEEVRQFREPKYVHREEGRNNGEVFVPVIHFQTLSPFSLSYSVNKDKTWIMIQRNKPNTYGKEINLVRKPLNSTEVPQKTVTGKPKTWSSTYIIFLYLKYKWRLRKINEWVWAGFNHNTFDTQSVRFSSPVDSPALRTPTGCPVTQFNSNINYWLLALDSMSQRLSLTRLPPLQTPVTGPRSFMLLTD